MPRLCSFAWMLPLCMLGWSAPALASPVQLTILHTNDTHDHLLPYDTADAKNVGGVARRAAWIREIKAQTPNVLVFDAGDSFQGTPLFSFFQGKADYDTLDLAGYDATTVGNHDLDDGLANLEKQVTGRRFLDICTNLRDPKTGKPIFVGSHVFERGGLKIGVFGVLGDDALQAVSTQNQQGFTFVPVRKAAEEAVKALRPHCDLVVMLSHSGLEEDEDLARHVAGIDVIVGGHSHTLVPHPVPVHDGRWQTLVLQASCYGQYIGRLDLTVDHGHILSYTGTLKRLTAAQPADRDEQTVVAAYESQIARAMSIVVAHAPQGLLGGDKGEHDTPLGDWTADAIRQAGGTEIGVMNAGGLRSDFLAGPIKVGDVYTVFPFDNRLVTLTLDGRTLQGLLDQAVKIHEPGNLQYAGLTFRVAGDRAVDARVNGQPLDPARRYTVATIDYLAGGNDGHELFKRGQNYHDSGKLLRDVILATLKAHPTVQAPATGRIAVQK